MSTPDLLKAEVKLSLLLFGTTSAAQTRGHHMVRMTQQQEITHHMTQAIYHRHPRLIQATMNVKIFVELFA